MKVRESGMPDEGLWTSFFNPEEVLRKLGLNENCLDVVDFGCGYGTFAIPAAQMIRGKVIALDCDAEMVAATTANAESAGLHNITVVQRDFVEQGADLPDQSAEYAMLFNILHAEEPLVLLREAWRVLTTGGRLAITHWNYDPSTPRGPSMAIRPPPAQCRAWCESVGFELLPPGLIALPPHHYGMVFQRTAVPTVASTASRRSRTAAPSAGSK